MYREDLCFKDLFKKHRLRSGFSTLSEFGKALADEGLIFEDSLFSRWQKGNRIPKDRNTLLKILRVFIKNSGITFLKEANDFLESAGQGYLTPLEMEILPKDILPNAPFQVPSEISNFTGRESYLKDIIKNLKLSKAVLIQGPPGIGKTALTVKAAYSLRDFYTDGILWYRLDTSSSANILAGIARTFGESINEIKDVETRASIVRSILHSKKVLLILDNVEIDNKTYLMLPSSKTCSIIITSRQKDLYIPYDYSILEVKPFNENEILSLFKSILGIKYVNRNQKNILKIAGIVGNLPLAVNILARQISNSSKNILSIIKLLKEEKIKLTSFKYSNENLYLSLNFILKDLDVLSKNLFSILGLFSGKDFSIAAVSELNRLNHSKTTEILENLVQRSLVERTGNNRYGLHPLIKLFSREKITSKRIYFDACDYYVRFLEKGGRDVSSFYPKVFEEQDNIEYIIKKNYELGNWGGVISLWEFIGVFLWDTGSWNNFRIFGEMTYKAALKANSKRAKAMVCIRELSWLYLWQGDLIQAKKFALEGLRLGKELKDEYVISLGKQRLALTIQETGEIKKSYDLLKEALKGFKNVDAKEYIVDTMLYLGHVLRKLNKIKDGKDYYKKSLKIAKQIGDVEAEAVTIYYIGELYLESGKFKNAEKFFYKAMEIDIKNNRQVGIAWNKMGLALIKKHKKEFENSKSLLLEARHTFNRLGMKPQINKVDKILIDALNLSR